MPLIPEIKAYENGGFSLAKANGWVQERGFPEKPWMVSIFSFTSEGREAELSITCTRLSTDGVMYIDYLEPLIPIYHQAFLLVDGDTVEKRLQNALNRALANLKEWVK